MAFGSALALTAMIGGLVPSRAQACGGCFAPMGPTGTPTTVDAHRMVIAVGPGRTVLWDQIVYEGSPSDFVWVLPVAPGTVVELSDNTFFEGLTATTQITLQAPLPPRSFCSDPCGLGANPFAAYGASAEVDAGAGFVMVEHQGTVGPYDTATIASDDPDALLVWMNDHGYLVDDAMRPILGFYAAQHLSFAVLRLSSASGVDRMQPVRVSMPGTSPSLPLRMVAAGAAVDLNLELFVFAEGRMEVSAYGNAEVDREAITYDWASGTFDYDQRFEDALFAGEGPGSNWVTEYAMPVTTWSIASARRWIDGVEHSPDADLEVVRSAFAADTPLTLTRLRTRLRPNDLRDDLTVRASAGGELPGLVRVTRERNRAPDRPCPTVCESSDGLSPGGSATRGAGTRYRCSVELGGARGGSGVLGVLGALGALAVVSRRRRGRRR